MLDAYAQSGGAWFSSLAGRCRPQTTTANLAGRRAMASACCRRGWARSWRTTACRRPDSIRSVTRHPIVQPFRGQEDAGLLSTPVFKYFKLSLPKDSKANVVLAIDPHADPLIVEESIHRGRVIVVATAADDSGWSAYPVADPRAHRSGSPGVCGRRPNPRAKPSRWRHPGRVDSRRVRRRAAFP